MVEKQEKQDLLVLEKLRANSRITLTEISNSLGIPVTTVFEKVKRLRKKVIVKYVDVVDFAKLGFVIRANFVVKAEESRREKLREFLMKHENVNSVFRTNNSFDFFVEALFSDMKQMDVFCEQLDSFKTRRKTHFVVEELKRECFCPTQE